YNINAKIIIDEAGNYATYDPDFFEQITYFSRHTLTDPRVLALTFYIWEDPTFSPGNIFNVWTQYILDLPAFTQKLAAQPDIVPGAAPAPEAPPAATPAAIPAGATFDGPTIHVMFDDGRIEAMTLEQYLRAVVPAEIPASWHPEAVKAQAVAARSYAANAIRRARYLNKAFDIRANPDIDQNYRPDKIHPASDAAVLTTAGLVLNNTHHPIPPVFSANCGGHTVNSEEVFKKKDGSPAPPTPYLRGVPCPAPGPKNGHGVGLCQHGANRFGQMGLTFDQILAHYYTGATLGRWTFDESAAAPTLAAVGDSPPQTWNLTITRTPGFSIIVGNLADRPNVQISVTTPGGDSFVSLSGSKPEFGSGGFEAMAATPGTYTLEFLGQRFNVQMDGQTTARLEFSTAGAAAPAAPPAQSALSGTLTDHRGAPLAGRTVRLQSAGGARTADTGPGGTYTFENLPAGTYNLSVPDTTISKTVTLDGREFKTVTLILAAAITSGGWTVDIQPRPGGLAFMVGDIGAANQPITVTAPGGAQTVTVSGSKPEYGPGGFEIYAPERGIYTLQFQDKTFTIPMEGQMLHLTFRPQAEAESQARLVSAPMPLSKAQTLLKQLTAQTGDGDAFKLEVI
ncbi:MAG: SpoIID/LytB domain-containing protein, partial [Anaerolineae bacterium]